jgi:hypothetical protein
MWHIPSSLTNRLNALELELRAFITRPQPQNRHTFAGFPPQDAFCLLPCSENIKENACKPGALPH